MIPVFDLAGVVFTDGLGIAVSRLSRVYGIPEAEIREGLNGPDARPYWTGEEDPEHFWKRLGKRLGIDSNELKSVFFESYKLKNSMISFLRELRTNGMKLGFLADSPEDRAEYLERKYRFLSMFDFGYFSYEAHARKPEKMIFEKFLKRFRLEPGSIVYIDDNPENTRTARKMGMKIILFRNEDQLREMLNNMKY